MKMRTLVSKMLHTLVICISLAVGEENTQSLVLTVWRTYRSSWYEHVAEYRAAPPVMLRRALLL